MTDESLILRKRFLELYGKSASYYTFTDFLGLAEQSELSSLKEISKMSLTLFGGAEGTERVIARFGNPDELGYEEEFPIKILKISPKAPKFAEKLSHRDYLGSILALGIEREVIGDIAVFDNCAYVFTHERISDYIISSLESVRRTPVNVAEASEITDGELYRTKRVRITASSERIDAIVAKIFSLSRDESSTVIKRGLVFIDGVLCTGGDKIPKKGQKVSVRGYGRFIYLGYEGTTKKGKLSIEADLYV